MRVYRNVKICMNANEGLIISAIEL